jgi:hypothetical protein
MSVLVRRPRASKYRRPEADPAVRAWLVNQRGQPGGRASSCEGQTIRLVRREVSADRENGNLGAAIFGAVADCGTAPEGMARMRMAQPVRNSHAVAF